MIYTNKIQKAVRFSVKTHEVYQKQKRKGKDVPYILHPLTVGLILARAGASEDVVIAGILHDTIEDSIAEKKVTRDMLAERFGDQVADLVVSVSEMRKDLSWEERKQEAFEHIATFSHDSMLVKSADLISNVSEIIADYERDGKAYFAHFTAPIDKLLQHYLRSITAIMERWPDNPLMYDLEAMAEEIHSIQFETETAGGIIVNELGEVALVQNGPGAFWGFPKGHIDPGEESIVAAVREIKEETGLNGLQYIKQLPTYTRFKGSPTGEDDKSELKKIHMFLFKSQGTHLKPEDPGNPEARWVNRDDVSEMLTHPKDKAYFDSIRSEIE